MYIVLVEHGLDTPEKFDFEYITLKNKKKKKNDEVEKTFEIELKTSKKNSYKLNTRIKLMVLT